MNTETNNKINDMITNIFEFLKKDQLDKKKLIDIIIKLKNIYNNTNSNYEIDIEPYEIWHKNKSYNNEKIKKNIQTSINNINKSNDMEIKKSNINSLIIDITKLHIIEYNKLSPLQKGDYIPMI